MSSISKFFKSSFVNIGILTEWRVALVLVIGIAFAIAYYLCSKNKNKDRLISRTALLTLSLMCYIYPFWVAIIHRIDKPRVDSTAKIFSGWLIWQSKYAFEVMPLANFFIFTPFAVFFAIYLVRFTSLNTKRLLLLPTLCSFALSLTIELIQLVTCLGTFQISDLVYNTISGFIGAGLVLLVKKLKLHFNK